MNRQLFPEERASRAPQDSRMAAGCGAKGCANSREQMSEPVQTDSRPFPRRQVVLPAPLLVVRSFAGSKLAGAGEEAAASRETVILAHL